MYLLTIILLGVTLLVYTFNITGLKIGKNIFVESCIQDEPIDIAFWLVFCIAYGLFIARPDIGKFVVFGFMLLCVAVQFIFTFRFFFKPDKRKIEGYNKFFAHTHHIITPSEERLIPDTYHIVIFILLMLNLINSIVGLFVF